MPGLLDDKVVAITGASSGIGEATALALASEGASVALAARRTDRIEALAGRIAALGARAVALPTDITDEESARAFIAETRERLGRLDVLVNNAGVMLLGPVEGAATEHWRRMVEVNLLGLLYNARTRRCPSCARAGEGTLSTSPRRQDAPPPRAARSTT